jgi:pullulanase
LAFLEGVALAVLVVAAGTRAVAPSEDGMSIADTPGDLQRARAHWVSRDTLLWDVTPAPGLVFFLLHAREGLDPTSPETPRIPLTPAADLAEAIRERFPHLARYTPFTVPPADAARAATLLKEQLALAALDAGGRLVTATSVQIPGSLDDVYRYEGPLGVAWEGGGVPTLRLWAPTAHSVRLRLFDTSGAPDGEVAPMNPDPATGVWAVRGTPAWNRKYYLYEVEVFAPSTGRVERNLVTDPYSLSLSTNSRRSQIVDLEDPSLRPAEWTRIAKPPLASPVDAVIYELHVRDFSIHDETVPAEHRGTFKAFTHAESNGMRHLRALAQAGLSHVHLLPAFDFATVNENRVERAEPDEAVLRSLPPDSDQQAAIAWALREKDGFNWGYDPLHYGAPEGSYATEPDGPARILEFREMVQALSAAGLRVVMDVVYNHTHANGQDPLSILDRIVPGYYHRLDGDGKVLNSTCCPNTATEHRMMEKLMLDTVVTWAKAYRVDGFRFDVMGHHMVSNMARVRAALDALTPSHDGVDGRGIYVYGEGWDFGEMAGNARGRNATQLNMAGTGIGTFNDRLRDAVRGGGAFGSPQEQGFATGLADGLSDAPQGTRTRVERKLLDLADWIRIGLAGNLRDFRFVAADGRRVLGSEVAYNGKPAGYTASPQEQIVYVSAHDNETLFDAIQWKAPASASVADRVRMNNLAVSIVALSQGVPFFHAGDDMLRSKSLDRNSFNSGDWWNSLDFTYASNNWGVGLPPGENESKWPLMRPLLADSRLRVSAADIRAARAHFQEMLKIRRSSGLFRLRTGEDVSRCLRFLSTGPEQLPGLIVMSLEDPTPQDPRRERIVVLFNARPTEAAFVAGPLRGAGFSLHEVQARSADPVVRRSAFDTRAGRFTVPGRTTAVFVEYEGKR